MPKIAGVVLAGGKSSRMGKDKARLKIGNKSLLNHAKNILKSTGLKAIFVSGKNGIQDREKDKGPIAGLLACLESLQQFDYLLFIPVDMPLLNKFVLLKLISQKNHCATYFQQKYLPILICNNVINRKIIQQQLDNNKLSLKNCLKQLDAQALKCHFPETVFANTNTKEEWQKIKKLLQ